MIILDELFKPHLLPCFDQHITQDAFGAPRKSSTPGKKLLTGDSVSISNMSAAPTGLSAGVFRINRIQEITFTGIFFMV
jgi:hypothetical protein